MRRFVVIGVVGALLVLGTVLSAEARGFRRAGRCCTPVSCCAEPTCCAEETCCPDPCCQSTCRAKRCGIQSCCTPRFRKARHHTRRHDTQRCCTSTCCEPTGGCCGTNGNGVPTEVEVDIEEAPTPTL